MYNSRLKFERHAMNSNKIIQQLEKEQLRENTPEFGPGDTVVVQVRVVEGSRERLQAFEGCLLYTSPSPRDS